MKNMKKIILLLTTAMLCGCAGRQEEKNVEVREDMPVRLEYSMNREYGAWGESQDEEYMQSVLNALRAVTYGKKTDMAVEDYGDVIVFIYEDGSKEIFSFEGDIYVAKDGQRYEVTGGLSRLRGLLKQMIEEE